MKTKVPVCIICLFSLNLAYGRWPSIDPQAEKYYPVSPYAYCNNNPVNFIDPDGKDVWEVNRKGEIINRIPDDTQDAFCMVQQVNGQWQRVDGQSVSFEYGTVESQKSYTEIRSRDGTVIIGAIAIWIFLAGNEP